MNNKNKKFSRNRKTRVERKIKMNDKMKTLSNKIKTGKKNKNFDEIKELEIELVKIKGANNPNRLQSELKELNKIFVIDKNLHQNKNEILRDYTGEFEMIGKLSIGRQICQNHIRFRDINGYESYFNSSDERYDAEDAIFNGYIYRTNTPQFNLVNISQYVNG